MGQTATSSAARYGSHTQWPGQQISSFGTSAQADLPEAPSKRKSTTGLSLHLHGCNSKIPLAVGACGRFLHVPETVGLRVQQRKSKSNDSQARLPAPKLNNECGVVPSSLDTTTIMEHQGCETTAMGDHVEEKKELAGEEGTHDRFFWTYTEEPHMSRRKAIIKAHPEVLKLCGPEPLTIPLVLAVVGLQVLCAYALRNSPILSVPFLFTAYAIGATANQNLFLAIHEISHNLAFKDPLANRLLAIVANLPIGIPYSASFRPYHLTHHKSLGVDGLDTDLPTALEAWFLDSVAGKAFFCTFQIFFYALRPMMVYKIPLTWIHALNITAQIAFDYILVRSFGSNALAYLILSSFLAGSLHPCAGHFIAEHYVFAQHSRALKSGMSVTATGRPPLPETFSYYGILNILTYNVGLHNEHHDFPAVPWTRLWKLNEIANEFYCDLPCHYSWVGVLWQFVGDKEVGLWCRVKRKEGGRKVGIRAARTESHTQPVELTR